MKLVFCSLRGAPGVTTLCLLCAANWPAGHTRVLIEADSAGGVLAARFGLASQQPNLLGLAASARHGISDDKIEAFCQQLPDAVPAVIAPARGADVRNAMEQLPLERLPDSQTDYLFDHGRLVPELYDQTPGADVVVMAVRPVYEQLDLLLSLATDLVYESLLGVVLVGKGPYHFSEIADQLQVECGERAMLLGVLPFDPKGAALVASEGPLAPLTRRSRIFKATHAIVDTLVALKSDKVSTEEQLSQELLDSLT